MSNEEQPRDHVVISTDGLRVYDTGGYEAEIGLDGSVVFKDKYGNIFEPSFDGSSVTYVSGNSTIKVETDGTVTLHTERGPGETTIVSKIGADGKTSIERATISGTPLSLGKKVMVVSVGVKLEWTPQDGWSLDGELQIFGMTLPEIADTAYAAVESSGVGQLMGSRDEWMQAVENGETTDSHLVWLRKRNQAQVKAETNQHFNEANAFVERFYDPLSLDLDGDGIETASASAGITFDFDGDGLKTGTGWVKGDDGFLVLDRNGNGQIDNGGELFGVDTVKANGQKASNGFDALKDFDSNGDGVFDARDTQFANVKIWQDANQDGIAQAGELKTLAEHNIVAINLDSAASNHNSNGNLISAVGSFIRRDGSEGTVNANQSLAANLDLASNPFYREFTDHIALDDTAKALPDMKGSGAVRDLREASMLNAELKTLLATYSQAQTREEQMGLLDQLIAEWAKSADYQTFDERIDALDEGTTDVRFQYSWEASGTQPTEAQQSAQKLLERVKALEVFNAQNILEFGKVGAEANSLTLSIGIGAGSSNSTYNTAQGNAVINENHLSMNAGQASLLNQAYESLKQSIYDGLALQTRLKPYADTIDLKLTTNGIELDYDRMHALFAAKANDSPFIAISDALDFSRVWKDKKSTDLLKASFIPALVEQLPAEELNRLRDQMLHFNSQHIQLGNASNDSLIGTSRNDYILGLGGNDYILGGYGNDTLVGGKGNDTLDGHNGSDTYVFSLGDGQDTLAEIYSSDSLATDIIRFTEGIDVAGMRMSREGKSLTLHYSATDSITLADWYSTPSVRVEKVEFADGSSRTINSLEMELGVTGTAGNDGFAPYGNDGAHFKGLAGNDLLNGSTGNDILDGGDGDDSLNGGYGNDTLLGGAGDDAILGGYGDDILIGGKGNDTLDGHDGSDTYVFSLGDGQDTLAEFYSSDSLATDIIRFTEGIDVTGMRMSREGKSLTLHYSATDSITLADWYSTPSVRVEKVEFADGSSRTINSLEMELGVTGTAGDDGFAPYGNDGAHFKGLAGNDLLNGSTGNDILDGGDGDDSLNGGYGNDTLLGGAGDDAILGGYGDDILIGGKGNDTLDGHDGSDTYVFSLGDGQDTLAEFYSSDSLATDIIRFTEGIDVTGMRMSREGKSLTLHYSATDSITLADWYSTPSVRVEKVEFADGSSRTINSLEMELGVTGTAGNDGFAPYGNDGAHFKGLAGNDVLNGASGNDILDGGDGDDSLNGGYGNDTLLGGAGDDAILGGYGDDILIGGKGNDTLDGHDGSDTYVFSLGDGQDTLAEFYSSDSLATDIIRFTEGIDVAGMRMSREGKNLTLHYSATDSITLANWYSTPSVRVEKVEFADGSSRTINSLEMELGVTGTAGNDGFAPYGNDGAHFKGLAGNDVLNGASGNDILDGGDGDDSLNGGYGNDTLLGERVTTPSSAATAMTSSSAARATTPSTAMTAVTPTSSASVMARTPWPSSTAATLSPPTSFASPKVSMSPACA
ncbi:hypothetical protein PHLH8_37960 [Pseudomonas sp. Pc102]|uniref:calcium-binding protein n=1 Tax=Pseudomonas sp. Pc102 TaxID=2678261 RepID=UPI001BCD8F72|nr:calcium-binding protein [Pseudomonas sp. Pc102]BBP84154.1 hypothetical protein PHLH8_37960 [Pseudomonas sp. Pc102]